MISNEKKIIIYSGTTEGRMLARCLSEAGIATIVCVATEYGQSVMEPMKDVEIRIGRKDAAEIYRELMEEEFSVVVDATHPFATEVTENVKSAAVRAGLPYVRFKRDTTSDRGKDISYFSSVSVCADKLYNTKGNIMLTTGSKELKSYIDAGIDRDRLYVRVLPGLESILVCQRYGIEGKHIIAIQGPFSEELNVALMKQYHIEHMVTKESGRNGGYDEKISAARSVGADIYVITNPEDIDNELYGSDENAIVVSSISEAAVQIANILGRDIEVNDSCKPSVKLVGVGMGDADSLTQEAVRAIKDADYILGAKRLTEAVSGLAERAKDIKEYYLAKDILPYLEQIDCNVTGNNESKVTVLFSGDTGFYSGADKLYKALTENGYENTEIIPGMPSISALAARFALVWQDADIKSIHGVARDKWEVSVRDILFNSSSEKIYLLLSDREQLIYILKFARTYSYDGVFYIGYQLSYDTETLYQGTAADILESGMEGFEEGLYSMFIVSKSKRNEIKSSKLYLLDTDFARNKVPMTKEEIRHLSVAKLNMDDKSVLYDIGCGTGSVGCEAANIYRKSKVYGIECNHTAVELSRKNVTALGLTNIEIIEGMAPEAYKKLPVPTHAFIGGSKGRLEEILSSLYVLNPNMRIVINAVSMETIAVLSRIEEQFEVENMNMVMVQVSNVKKLGTYHMMQGENPVYICSFSFCEKQDKRIDGRN